MKSMIFYKVLEMSLNASFIILIMMLVRLCFRSKPKVFSYVLWFAVFARLLCPFSIELPISFIPENVSNGLAMKAWTDTYVGEHEIFQNNSEEFDTAIENGIAPILQKDESGEIEGAYVVTGEDGISNPDTIYNVWIPKLSTFWLLGIFLIFIYSIFTYLKMKKNLVGAVPLDEEKDIYLSDYIQTAFVIGTFYPKIYLPSFLSQQEQEYILMHEMHHVRRKDHWVKTAAFLALSIHWFNPLVWIAFDLFCEDMEMSCDEAVLKKMDGDMREEYAKSLLSLSTGKMAVVGVPLAFGEGDTKKRITNAIHWKKATFRTLALTGIVCVFIGSISLANTENSDYAHPYEWTSSVKKGDIDRCEVTSWANDELQFDISEKQLEDLVYVLNGISRKNIAEVSTAAKKEITVALDCGDREFLLTYGDGVTLISFDNDTGLLFEKRVWQIEDKNLSRCMENLISKAIENQWKSEEETMPLPDEVSEMREQVLEGMSEEERDRLRELVKALNLEMEYDYIYTYFQFLHDVDSPCWDAFSQSGEVHVGWGTRLGAPGFDSDGEMTLEEYREKYMTPIYWQIEIPWEENFYSIMDECISMIRNESLKADFLIMKECMKIAVETHDVDYIYQIYYILHDMDYFLLRYGPGDVGMYTIDDSTVRKYYGVLQVYQMRGNGGGI